MVLVAASVCVALAPARSASAQGGVPIRASYQGQFLPEGTEIVVLTREGRVQRDGRYQPEFFPTRDFPRQSRSTLRRERLAEAGRSNRVYEGTQESGRLYFLYALAPDSTLYWSYSAKRDSLKYDVVSSGVMSVAPVPTPEMRDDILSSFFRSRVTVVIRGQESREPVQDDRETGGAGDDLSNFSLTDLEVDSASITTAEVPPPSDLRGAAHDTAAIAQTDTPPAATALRPARAASSGVMLSPSFAWFLVILLVCVIGVPAYVARTSRAELKQVRREMLALRHRMASRDKAVEPRGDGSIDDLAPPAVTKDTPSHAESEVEHLRAALEDARLRYHELEEDYDILQARYETLAREAA